MEINKATDNDGSVVVSDIRGVDIHKIEFRKFLRHAGSAGVVRQSDLVQVTVIHLCTIALRLFKRAGHICDHFFGVAVVLE